MKNNNFILRLQKSNASKWFIAALAAVTLLIIVFGAAFILTEEANVFKTISFIILMMWICIFLSYFVWAIYFYNFNLGLTNKEWKKINDAKDNRSKGEYFNQEDIDAEPKYNPYKDETFGVPPGTVRGMIAFTLLFGAIALLIASFGMENNFQAGGFFYDQFEFFKTAFLMMIAFYFGSRSLQYLKSGNTGVIQTGEKTPSQNEKSTNSHANSSNPAEIVVIHKDPPKVKKGEIPPIVAIDPMNPIK